MKLIAGLLITICLVIGSLAAATAYNPLLEDIDPGATPLTLNAPAGAATDEDGEATPLLDPDASEEPIMLTSQVIQQLRDADVQRVRVKEFSWSRWGSKWIFVLSCVGLLLGAGIIRVTTKRAIAAMEQTVRPPTETPEHALQAARDEVETLIQAKGQSNTPHDRAHAITEVLDAIRSTHQVAVEAAALELTARLGMSGYAQFMDRFARAERQLHRAWSAAVDGVMDESEICLVNARDGLDEARQRLT